MLLGLLKVLIQRSTSPEAKQTCNTHEGMVRRAVVLEMVLQSPLIVECAEAHIAEDVMVQRVLLVVFESVVIFENTSTQVAVMLVVRILLDVRKEGRLVRKL